VALVAAAVSTGTGIRDQETTLGTEAQFLDGATGKVIAQVVRKGTGKPLDNAAQVMKADDVKSVIDGWASDLHQSYVKLRNH
jgi:adenine C2-methylase RlmN of 23S rRNA A2503 and tRNA A37